jgi:hypothetical protein
MVPYSHLYTDTESNRNVQIDKEFWAGPSLIPKFYQRGNKTKIWSQYTNKNHAKNDIKTSKELIHNYNKSHKNKNGKVIYRYTKFTTILIKYIHQSLRGCHKSGRLVNFVIAIYMKEKIEKFIFYLLSSIKVFILANVDTFISLT